MRGADTKVKTKCVISKDGTGWVWVVWARIEGSSGKMCLAVETGFQNPEEAETNFKEYQRRIAGAKIKVVKKEQATND